MALPTLVFVHGRSQEFKDPEVLRRNWLAGLNGGLTRLGVATLPVERVVFPFYGDDLYHITADLRTQKTSVRLEGLPAAPGEAGPLHPGLPEDTGRLERQIIADLADAADVPPPPGVVRPEGLGTKILSWGGTRKILGAIAQRTRLDQEIIAGQVRDVAVYMTHGRDQVLDIVRRAVPAAGPLVLVTHSLGTVVGRDLLDDADIRRRTTLWVTAGSPLGLEAVQRNLRTPGAVNPQVPWMTTYDTKDVVALGHPLTKMWGEPLTEIQVDNAAEPHSITAYLGHPEVARPIGEAAGVDS